MKRMAVIAAISMFTGILFVCPASAVDPRTKPLLWLEHADVNADFQCHVVRQHDARFIGVYGYAATIPGVDETLKPRFIRQRRVRFIEGTSDAITSPEYGRLVDKAYDYAKRYNTLLLHYLRDNPNA
jgi:hypothetical protein